MKLDKKETYQLEKFDCSYCGEIFHSPVVTWVDVSEAPQLRLKILQREFNMVTCPRCGSKAFADVPFFYEDFEEGILISVFPSRPVRIDAVEKSIRERYSYYPFLEFFYDMTQLWVLVYMYFYRLENTGRFSGSSTLEGDNMTEKTLQFIKTNGVMLHIREKLAESFHKLAAYDELINAVERSIFWIEKQTRDHPRRK